MSAVTYIEAPLPRIRDKAGRLMGERVVMRVEPGQIRVQHCPTLDEARAVELAWKQGNFRYWPGQTRRIGASK